MPVGRVEAGGLHVYINAGGSGAISPNHSKPESERDKKKKGAGGGPVGGRLGPCVKLKHCWSCGGASVGGTATREAREWESGSPSGGEKGMDT